MNAIASVFARRAAFAHAAALLLRREGRKQEIARLFKVMSHEDLVASDIDHDGRVDEAEFVLL